MLSSLSGAGRATCKLSARQNCMLGSPKPQTIEHRSFMQSRAVNTNYDTLGFLMISMADMMVDVVSLILNAFAG